MDLVVLARDSTGLYRVLKLAKRTGAGHVIQSLPGAAASGLHRTWHADGYVHDRSMHPPSTTSEGRIQKPDTAMDECYARHDLTAGQLDTQFTRVDREPNSGSVIVDLTTSNPFQRLEVWYTQRQSVAVLEARILAAAAGGFHKRHCDEDGGLARLIVAFTPQVVCGPPSN